MGEREELLSQIARLELLKVTTRRMTIGLIVGSVLFAGLFTSGSIKVMDTQEVFNARMPHRQQKE